MQVTMNKTDSQKIVPPEILPKIGNFMVSYSIAEDEEFFLIFVSFTAVML